MSAELLCSERALIFRITHLRNVPGILRNGLHCRSSSARDPAFREIGSPELIAKRSERKVPVPPGGTLSDDIPFYFTPWSPMLYNIVTGRIDGPRTRPEEIAFLVSSVPRLDAR